MHFCIILITVMSQFITLDFHLGVGEGGAVGRGLDLFTNYLNNQLKIKEKTVESSGIQLMFLSRSTEKQAGHDGKTIVID